MKTVTIGNVSKSFIRKLTFFYWENLLKSNNGNKQQIKEQKSKNRKIFPSQSCNTKASSKLDNAVFNNLMIRYVVEQIQQVSNHSGTTSDIYNQTSTLTSLPDISASAPMFIYQPYHAAEIQKTITSSRRDTKQTFIWRRGKKKLAEPITDIDSS